MQSMLTSANGEIVRRCISRNILRESLRPRQIEKQSAWIRIVYSLPGSSSGQCTGKTSSPASDKKADKPAHKPLRGFVRNGAKLYFGSENDLAAKWASAAAVLADSGSDGADYIDITVASRPVAGTGSDTASTPGSTTGGEGSAGTSGTDGSAAATGSITGG